MTRLLLAALSLALLSLPTAARADVTLTLTPDASTATVLSPEGWTLQATGDGDLAPTLILPGHGAGELAGDEPGDPVYGKNDAKTTFVVTDAAGAMQTGRVLSWPVMTAPFSLHVSVLTPALAAWFHAGAGASWSSTPVLGVAKGGQISVSQSGVVNSGWFDASAYPRVFLEWDVSNTTNHAISLGGSDAQSHDVQGSHRADHRRSYPSGHADRVGLGRDDRLVLRELRGRGLQGDHRGSGVAGEAADVQLVAERLGLPAGFTLVSSTLGDPEYRSSPHSFSAEWSDAVTIPPHSSIEWDVWLDAPCGSGVVHARLQITLADGTRSGTGNKGPALELEAC